MPKHSPPPAIAKDRESMDAVIEDVSQHLKETAKKNKADRKKGILPTIPESWKDLKPRDWVQY